MRRQVTEERHLIQLPTYLRHAPTLNTEYIDHIFLFDVAGKVIFHTKEHISAKFSRVSDDVTVIITISLNFRSYRNNFRNNLR